MSGFDSPNLAVKLNYPTPPDELIDIEIFDTPRTVDKVIWCVNVRACMSPETKIRYICAVTCSDLPDAFDLYKRIALIDRHTRADRYRDIVKFHWGLE